MSLADILIPTQLGDESAKLSPANAVVTKINTSGNYAPTDTITGMGVPNDCVLYPGFLSEEEADLAFNNLMSTEEFQFQQWYHMPDEKTGVLQPLRRVKIAMATPGQNGLIPHYRFPVNDQKRHGTLAPMTPTVETIRQKVNSLFGMEFNHAVILLYRNGDDCIGYHKDKVLDLDERAPVVSVSLGVPRLYTLRDNIRVPKIQQEFVLPHGALFALGYQTNEHFYHSIRPAESLEEFGSMHTTCRISLTFRKVLTYRDPTTEHLSGKGADYQTLNWPEDLKGRHIVQE